MILGTSLLALGGLMIWSGMTGQNGFAELGKLLRGEPAFVRPRSNVEGGGGSFTGGEEGAGSGGGGGGGGAW